MPMFLNVTHLGLQQDTYQEPMLHGYLMVLAWYQPPEFKFASFTRRSISHAMSYIDASGDYEPHLLDHNENYYKLTNPFDFSIFEVETVRKTIIVFPGHDVI